MYDPDSYDHRQYRADFRRGYRQGFASSFAASFKRWFIIGAAVTFIGMFLIALIAGYINRPPVAGPDYGVYVPGRGYSICDMPETAFADRPMWCFQAENPIPWWYRR